MNFHRLEKVLCDLIKEQQIKLGYEKETLRLYFPMSSLGHILEIKDINHKSLDHALHQFMNLVKNKLGNIEVSNKGDRYCILIPPKGVEFVHLEYEDKPFIRDFIQVISNHDCTLDKLLEVFHKYSPDVICLESEIEDFDYVIYFADESIDDYRYCVQFDLGHTIYHRFIKEDYENL